MNKNIKKFIPNLVTLLRILLVLPVILLLPIYEKTAIVLILIVFLTDILDGYLARKLDVVSNQGIILDPLADKIFSISIFSTMISFGYISSYPVVLILFREFFISGLRGASAKLGNPFPASKYGKFKTLFQNLAILAILYLKKSCYSEVIAYAVALVSILSCISYASHMKLELK